MKSSRQLQTKHRHLLYLANSVSEKNLKNSKFYMHSLGLKYELGLARLFFCFFANNYLKPCAQQTIVKTMKTTLETTHTQQQQIMAGFTVLFL